MKRAWLSLAPWCGLIAGALIWSLHQQWASDALHFHCGPRHNLLAGVVGLVAALMVAIGGLVSWRSSLETTALRRFVGQMGTLAATLFVLAILMQTMAAFTVPACFG